MIENDFKRLAKVLENKQREEEDDNEEEMGKDMTSEEVNLRFCLQKEMNDKYNLYVLFKAQFATKMQHMK